jgi:predicted phage tail protein
MTMRTIKLYGVLRKHFGREYRIDVHSVRDAVNALCAMKPGFEKFLRTGEERGLVFSVFCGKRNAGEAEFDMQGSDNTDIRIVPLIQGSKQAGLFQVVLGVALVVGGLVSGGTSTALGLGLLGAGAATGLGGVVQMLSPTTTASVGNNNNDDGNNPSYGFGGAVTTVAQGNPYPVLYGEREIGGAVESGGIYTQDQL